MWPKMRWFSILLTCAMLAVGLALVWYNAPPTSAAGYSGLAQIEGPVQLDMAISPPAGSPRDTLQLKLQIRNREPQTAAPIILVSLPSSLRLDTTNMPRGATMNLQTNSLQWLPVVEPGQGIELVLPMRVETADLTNPEETITTVLRYAGAEKQAAATIWLGLPPQINQVLAQTHVAVGQPLQLRADVGGPGPLKQEWDLGDGRHVEVNDPQIVYPAAGVYTVELTLSNPVGEIKRKAEITVVPHVAAQFETIDETIGIGQSITFNNQSGGQGPLHYTWNFGDGSISQDAHPNHVYQTPGIYEVSLLVENELGQAHISKTVTVGLPPEADFVVVESAPAGELVFGQAVGDASVTEYAWEMGDGRTYSGAEVNHTYRQSGDYYVTMVARNEFGLTRMGKWVHVDPGTLKVFMPLVSNLGGLIEGSSADAGNDPSGLVLAPVELDQPFTLEPEAMLPGSTPAEQLFVYINAARRQFDLAPLEVSPVLVTVAQAHAADMASYRHTNHVGSDGSIPPERLLYLGYSHGYAGEATAWGFSEPRSAVEYWINSDDHRPIILNKYATDLGVSQVVDYSTPSVWYWTAEFGNKFASAWQPALRLQEPAGGLTTLNSSLLTFSWNWSQPLPPSAQFKLYFDDGARIIPVGSIASPLLNTRYGLVINLIDYPNLVGDFTWFVRLENQGAKLAESERRSMAIELDLTLPVTTAEPTTAPTIIPPLDVTASPTGTAVPPTATPRPTQPPPPVLVTATPPLPPVLITATPLPTPTPQE